ncbi:MAG: hypothetical protein A2W90_21370 [Bacteroidetes bacterium GWF2_42_66]|nr:MAG: hypothetical protein A2W92_02485 [Bacteroidetes bacterium GWA2_42_15]OFX98884.1 MAG: hypothetical protein A2W89_13005 [Bacteroidetes bacterium GWE2_42_39]OFY45599.1 MAG: hypothetical protein A2W90_21370 [Bacteroidetes bacterium GWF2_42_66]HBL77421.1 hypothetical protein [Prolixibacteraceae bacterium]HCU62415.1 hypothetical protein [Prolixibacteraceae bacterium]
MTKTVIIALLMYIATGVKSQTNNQLSSVLDSLSVSSIPQLNQNVDISFSNITIQELVRTLGNTAGLNITMDQGINYSVNANFNNVKARDVLDYLCSNYKLTLKVHGNIIHIQPVPNNEKRLFVEMTEDSLLSYDIYKITGEAFFSHFTEKTGCNFVLSPEVPGFNINGYAKKIRFNEALLQLAATNKLDIREMTPQLFSVSPANTKNPGETPNVQSGKKEKKFNLGYTNGLITAEINDVPLEDILKELALQSGYSVYMLSSLEAKTSINARDTDLSGFLNALFYGSENTYRMDGNILFTGARKLSDIKSFELIKLNNRRVDSLIAIIPQQVKQELIIKEFNEQNSIMVWGDADQIFYFRKSIEKIDIVVPVILIDVIIVDAGKNFEIETGLELGLDAEAEPTSGKINPGLDYTMNAGSVNNFLGRVGLANLGKVSPNFYVKLKAMETDGILEIRSTPQLATLNGHSATMSIGQTEYYKEELSNIWGTQNPQLQTQSQYKPVEAKLGISIKPIVAGNGQVTLNIDVEQSDFTERIEETAPPGLESRKFSSMIRVKNQEMILLGGLEESLNSSNRSGWPFLSRIPVLNWVFASKSERKNKSHLNIFIRPTVIY